MSHEGENWRGQGVGVEELVVVRAVDLEGTVNGGGDEAGDGLAVEGSGSACEGMRRPWVHLLKRSSAESQVRFGKTPDLTLSTFVPSRIAVVTCKKTISVLSERGPTLKRTHLLGNGSRQLKVEQLGLERGWSKGQRCHPTRDPSFDDVAQVGLSRDEARVTQAELGVLDSTLPLEACESVLVACQQNVSCYELAREAEERLTCLLQEAGDELVSGDGRIVAILALWKSRSRRWQCHQRLVVLDDGEAGSRKPNREASQLLLRQISRIPHLDSNELARRRQGTSTSRAGCSCSACLGRLGAARRVRGRRNSREAFGTTRDDEQLPRLEVSILRFFRNVRD